MTALVVVCALTWWLHDDDASAVPGPAAAQVIGDGALPHDVCSASTAAPVAAARPAPALKLKGTVMAGASSFAMVRHTTDARLLELRAGDLVDGFVVTAIESDRVVLAGGGRSVVLEAEPEPEAAAAVPAMAAPTVAAATVAAAPVPQLIPIEQLPPAYRGPAPEDEVLGH